MTHRSTEALQNGGVYFVIPKFKKTSAVIEIVSLALLVVASFLVPKQQNVLSNTDSKESSTKNSIFSLISSKEMMMTSDKVYLPDAWSISMHEQDSKSDLRILNLKSNQVRFVQPRLERSPSSESDQLIEWQIQSIKRIGHGGHVETLAVSSIDGERTTPYVELYPGFNDFSVVYENPKNRTQVQRKKLRLVPQSTKSTL